MVIKPGHRVARRDQNGIKKSVVAHVDEKLRSRRVGLIGAGHGQRAKQVLWPAAAKRLAAFVHHGWAGFFFDKLCVKSTALHHEVVYDAMKNSPVIVLVAHILQKVFHGFWRLVRVDLHHKLTRTGDKADPGSFLSPGA